MHKIEELKNKGTQRKQELKEKKIIKNPSRWGFGGNQRSNRNNRALFSCTAWP